MSLKNDKFQQKLVVFRGGAGESRTRVRKPLDITFSGCRMPFVLPAHISDIRDIQVGILFVRDGCKEKLAVHVRRYGYAR